MAKLRKRLHSDEVVELGYIRLRVGKGRWEGGMLVSLRVLGGAARGMRLIDKYQALGKKQCSAMSSSE